MLVSAPVRVAHVLNVPCPHSWGHVFSATLPDIKTPVSENPARRARPVTRAPMFSPTYTKAPHVPPPHWRQIVSLLSFSDPDSTWLTITNIILGAVVILCVAIMLGGIAHEFISRARKRRRIDAELDRDMRLLNDDHAFDSPNLGITMADGGEKHEP